MTLWDDEYTGPRWTYRLMYRPLNVWFPQDFIITPHRPPSTDRRFPHGFVSYPRPLTEQEIAAHELMLVASPDDVRQLEDAAQGAASEFTPVTGDPNEPPF